MDMKQWAQLTTASVCGLATVLMSQEAHERKRDSIVRALRAAADIYLHCGIAAMEGGIDLLKRAELDQLETAVADLKAMYAESEAE